MQTQIFLKKHQGKEWTQKGNTGTHHSKINICPGWGEPSWQYAVYLGGFGEGESVFQ